MDMPEGLKWAITFAAALLASKLWDVIRDRRARRDVLEDRADDIHHSNEAARLGANVSLVTELIKRVESLEATQKEQGEKLMALTDTNARLDERNKALQKDNDRLSNELQEVKTESTRRQGRISELEKQVLELHGQVAELIAIQRGEK